MSQVIIDKLDELLLVTKEHTKQIERIEDSLKAIKLLDSEQIHFDLRHLTIDDVVRIMQDKAKREQFPYKGTYMEIK